MFGRNVYWTKWLLAEVGLDEVVMDEMAMDEMGLEEMAIDHQRVKCYQYQYCKKIIPVSDCLHGTLYTYDFILMLSTKDSNV